MKSMDIHGSKQGGHGCPVQGAHEDIGQFVVVISWVWEILARPQGILLLVSGSIKRVHSFSIYRYFHAATTRVARSIAPANLAVERARVYNCVTGCRKLNEMRDLSRTTLCIRMYFYVSYIIDENTKRVSNQERISTDT